AYARSLRPLSRGTPHDRGQRRQAPCRWPADARCHRQAAGRGARACPYAGVPSARCGAPVAPGHARCRLDGHRLGDVVPTRVFPRFPDPRRGGSQDARGDVQMTDKTLKPPSHTEPVVFTREQLDWLPWLEPVAEDQLTARQKESLVDAARAKSDYF